jgi:hypothetical protein
MNRYAVTRRGDAAVVRWRPDRFVWAVVLTYAACRLVSAAVLVAVAPYQEPVGWTGPTVSYLSFTQQWDAQWYQEVIRNGYPAELPRDALGNVQQNAWAFYPLYPLSAKALIALTHADPVLVTSTWSLVLGAVAAVLLGLLLRRRLGPVAALLVVTVFASAPAAPVLQVAYTESLAFALLFGFLLALDSARWYTAAGLALLIGITRPIAVPLAVVALVAVWLRWKHRRTRPLRRPDAVAMVAMLASCGVAGVLWPTIAGLVTGTASAYTQTMASWRASGQITPLIPWFDNARYFFGEDHGMWVLVVGVLVVGASSVGPWAAGLGPIVRAWSLAYPAYLLVVLDPGTSLYRYLIPIVSLAAVPIGVAGVSAGTDGGPPGPDEWRVPRIRVLAATVVVLAACVVGQYLWVDGLWRFVPPSDWPP